MVSATIINFNDAENTSPAAKIEVEKGIKKKFGGASGAGEIMISWNSDKEHAVDIAKLEDDNFDSKFSKLAEDTRDDLFISMRASPQLFGLSITSGFNTQEFEEAFALANKTYIKPVQNEITNCIDKVFGLGDYSDINDVHAIEFIPFSLNTLQNKYRNETNHFGKYRETKKMTVIWMRMCRRMTFA
ncbi:hypothetical protein [Enterocloster citroniae]